MFKSLLISTVVATCPVGTSFQDWKNQDILLETQRGVSILDTSITDSFLINSIINNATKRYGPREEEVNISRIHVFKVTADRIFVVFFDDTDCARHVIVTGEEGFAELLTITSY